MTRSTPPLHQPLWSLFHRLPPARRRLLAISAALCALAVVIGACSLDVPSSASNGAPSNGGSLATSNGQTTTVKIIHGSGNSALILVPVTIDGQGPYDFALDTGAGVTLIDNALADRLQLAVAGDSYPVTGVGGSQDITPVHVDSWAAGNIKLPAADIGKTGLPGFQQQSDVQGLLGSDILSQFGSITIDYQTNQLSAWHGTNTSMGMSIDTAPQASADPRREPRAA